MIWNRLKKNRAITLSLFGLFSLFFSFFFVSKTSASSIDLNNIFFQNRYNWTSSNTGTYNSNRRYGYYPTFANIITPSSGAPNLDYVTPYDSPQGAFATTFTTNGITILDNAMSFHGELNIVAFNQGLNSRTFSFYTPLLDTLRVKSCANRAIASQSVSYALTDWSYTIPYQYGQWYYSLTTLTLYIDLTITALDVGTTDYLACTIGYDSDDAFFRTNTGQGRSYLYAEKFDTNYLFFNTPNEALQQTQINIMNNQYQLMQSQYDQEQQDRSNLEDVSNDATVDGDNATASAENATTNLLQAISSIYALVLNPQYTDCNIGPINLYGQMNLGTLDMCTFNTPQPLWAIGALVTIGIILLLAWSVLHSFMSLYKDLFGGK